MTLTGLLKADAARQLHFAGRPGARVTTWGLLRMMFSPRFVPVLHYRVAYWCATHRLRPLAKLLSLVNFVVFGLEIAVDCEIGPGLYFPHTQGTVIGARRIGKNAVIYHGVTLGAKMPDLAYRPELRPELGDDVVLGSGAKILGDLVVGSRSVVGANAVLLDSVPADVVVAGIPAQIVKRKTVAEDPPSAKSAP